MYICNLRQPMYQDSKFHDIENPEHGKFRSGWKGPDFWT